MKIKKKEVEKPSKTSKILMVFEFLVFIYLVIKILIKKSYTYLELGICLAIIVILELLVRYFDKKEKVKGKKGKK